MAAFLALVNLSSIFPIPLPCERFVRSLVYLPFLLLLAQDARIEGFCYSRDVVDEGEMWGFEKRDEGGTWGFENGEEGRTW